MARVPFDREQLPRDVRLALADGDALAADDARELLEERWACTPAKPIEKVAMAWMLHVTATRIHVDDVVEFCERGLELLQEAEGEGFDPVVVAKVRKPLVQASRREKKRRKTVQMLLRQPLEELTVSQLKDLQHSLGDHTHDPESMVLRARMCELVVERDPSAARWYSYLAAFAWADAGEWERAEAPLQELMSGPIDAFLTANDWFIGHAFYKALDRVIDDPVGFGSVFRQAVQRLQLFDDSFPAAHPLQESYLVVAHRHRNREAAAHLLSVLSGRRPRTLSTATKALIHTVEAWLETS